MASERSEAFSLELRRGLYEAIFRRRDVRTFLPDPVPPDVLARILIAAHHAPSVGFTQPWDFVIVRDPERRRRVKEIFEQEREKNAAQFEGARRSKFLALKLEGIVEAPLNLIVTCTPERFGPAVLGRVSIREVESYSTCLAVENLWLAARAEGLGVGWVSILRNEALAQIFAIPKSVIPIAYLCVGYVREFPARPLLQSAGWQDRLPSHTLLHFDTWTGEDDSGAVRESVERTASWDGILKDADLAGS
jgi:5,6-dimethylbenzimidazole synthase